MISDIVCQMDSLQNQKTRRLTNLYRILKQNRMDKMNRMEFLIRLSDALRNEVQTSSAVMEVRICPKNNFRGFSAISRMVSSQLTQLLEREQQLLMANIDEKFLDELRERQNLLFTDVIAGNEIFKKSSTRELASSKICSKCNQTQSVDNFSFSVRSGESKICRQCESENDAGIDISTYKSILRTVQRDERKFKAISSCAFILQIEDVRIIVDQIWHGRSAISQCNDISKLR